MTMGVHKHAPSQAEASSQNVEPLKILNMNNNLQTDTKAALESPQRKYVLYKLKTILIVKFERFIKQEI